MTSENSSIHGPNSRQTKNIKYSGNLKNKIFWKLNSAFEKFDAIQVSEQNKAHFLEAAKWGKFLAIVGFVFIGLMLVIALFMLFGLGTFMARFGAPTPVNFGGLGLLYIGMAALYFFPTFYLFIFATKMKKAVLCNDNNDFSTSVENLKSMFKFMGILTIVILSFYALSLFIMVLALI